MGRRPVTVSQNTFGIASHEIFIHSRGMQSARGGMLAPDSRKDRNKDGFLKRNLQSMPEAIIEQFDSMSCKDKKKLVNEVVVRGDDGQWTIDVQAPILKEWQEKYTDIRKDRGLITKPSGIASQIWGDGISLLLPRNEKKYGKYTTQTTVVHIGSGRSLRKRCVKDTVAV